MIEVEKKYSVDKKRFDSIERLLWRLSEQDQIDAINDETEENILYGSDCLVEGSVLRIRKLKSIGFGTTNVLTYKEPISNEEGLKKLTEVETSVASSKPLEIILEKVGFKPVLVYEKVRKTWDWQGAVVALDVLPFGYYIEIEGKEEKIIEIEQALDLAEHIEPKSYPTLTRELGQAKNGLIEARF